MKSLFLISPGFFLLMGNSFAQSPCVNLKIETPAVAKPANGSMVSINCSQLVIKWQGSANQSYIARATWFNTVTKKIDSVVATSTSCNSSFNCTATIPVKAGTKVSWTVQASSVIDGRTFYSYPFRGNQEFPVPVCVALAQKTADPNMAQPVALNLAGNKLFVFPNPVTGQLTVNWRGEYKGDATITIADAGGNEIKRINIKKSQVSYLTKVQVNAFAAGVYYMQVRTSNGKILSARFVKE